MAWTNLPTGYSSASDPAGGRDNAKYYAFDALSVNQAVNAIVGGVATATVATSEACTSTSYADLTTTTDTVTVTIGSSGIALVVFSAQVVFVSGTANYPYISFALSGANTVSAADSMSARSHIAAASSMASADAVRILTGLSSGSTTFKMKYRVPSGQFDISNRRIAVIPFP